MAHLRRIRRWVLLIFELLVLVGVLPVSRTRASEPPSQPAGTGPSLFQRLIRERTGWNGYEELVLAGEALDASKLFSRYQLAGILRGIAWPKGMPVPEELRRDLRDAEEATTLAFKRRVLADPPVLRALALLRAGLTKPVAAPQGAAYEDLGSASSVFHRLGDLLSLRQYVLFADGRVPEAIANAELWLRLGEAAKTDTLGSGLDGASTTGLCARSIGAHLDQFGASDCDRMLQVCLERLRHPAPVQHLLEAERQFIKANMAEIKSDLQRKGIACLADDYGVTLDAPAEEEGESGENQEVIAVLKRLCAGPPAALELFFQEVGREVDNAFDRTVAEAKKPAWERARRDPPSHSSLAFRFFSLVFFYAVDESWALDSLTIEEARIHLLACHLAIRRYRWEHDRLPGTLSVLNLGDLEIDPFTGQPIRYQVQGSRYQLTSAGRLAPPDNPNAVDGRFSLSITPKD